MLTRLYIDNFRCFEKFEWKPGRKQLILGRNGTGKSSLMDALGYLRETTARGDRVDRWFDLGQRTRWRAEANQVFELDARLQGTSYRYRLVLGPSPEPAKASVQSESLRIEDEPVLTFENGRAFLRGTQAGYPLEPARSALSLIGAPEVDPFREWLWKTKLWRINPFEMGSRAERADPGPKVDLTNMADWYRYLAQAYPGEDHAAFGHDLQQSLDGFKQLWLEKAGEDVEVLYAEFGGRGDNVRIPFASLSDGQRSLICLYAIVHFAVAKGGTVFVDEPDNFISLREIQPWLMAIEDMADDHNGQVILISHHPEILNQWANPYGVQFVRDAAGPVRVEKFKGDPEGSLTASEVVAGGWDFD